MSYTKIIQSGEIIEQFEYEKEPIPFKARKKSTRRSINGRRRVANVQAARSAFFRLVRANISANSKPAFLTLTMREVVPLRQGWRAATLFFQRLSRKYPPKAIAYIVVPEFQRRGAVHFHALVWGLSDDDIDQERSTRRIAELWSLGFIDIIHTDGSPKLATYLAKYMSKSLSDSRCFASKAYSGSRHLVRSVRVTSRLAVNVLQMQIEGHRLMSDGSFLKGVDKPLVSIRERSYTTKWLGRCNYKVFNLSGNYEE